MPLPRTADPTAAHGDGASDHLTGATRPDVPVTPDLRHERPAVSALRLVGRKPTLLLPLSLVSLVPTLGSAAADVVRARTRPALVDDGMLVFAGPPSTATVVTVVAFGLLAAAASGAALGVVVLRTGALLLGVRSGLVASWRETLRRWPVTLGAGLLLGPASFVVVVAALTLMLLTGPVAGGVLAAALLALAVQATVRVTRPFVAALLHGTRVRDATSPPGTATARPTHRAGVRCTCWSARPWRSSPSPGAPGGRSGIAPGRWGAPSSPTGCRPSQAPCS